jgi:hypothetical protein
VRPPGLLFATVVLATALSSGCASTGSTGTAAGAATAGTTAPASPAAGAPASPLAATATASGTARAVAGADTAGLPDGYDGGRDAAADIKAALALSATDHRQVLLDFGANWCPDCRVLDKLFRSPEVAPQLTRDYRVVAVDLGRFDHNVELASQYVDLHTSGIPALVVLGPDGTVRTATNDGAFANARTMDAKAVSAFLTRWAPK